MQIEWLGLATFKIQSNQSVIITDPYADSSGLTLPKLKADIIVITDPTSDLANNSQRLSGDGFIIDGPGEYETRNTFVYGLSGGPTIYLLEDEGIKVAFLGALDTDLTEKQLEMIEGCDILLLPIGTLDKTQRNQIIGQVEPRMIIPYLYAQPKVKQKFETLDVWLKEMGSTNTESLDKLKIKASDLPQEETTVTVLKPSK